VAVQVRHFLFGDVTDLSFCDFTDLFLKRLSGTLRDSSGLLQHFGDRSDLQDEVVGAVFVHRDDTRNNFAATVSGCIVEFLTKFRDVETLRTKSGTDRRGWVGCASDDLQFDECFDFFGHKISSLTRSGSTRSASFQERQRGRLDFFDLCKIEFQRRFAAKHRHEDLDLTSRTVDVNDLSFEFLERTITDFDGHADLDVDRERGFLARCHALEESLDFLFRERGRCRAGSDEPCHVWRVANHVPRTVIHDHFDEHIAREDFFFHHLALPVLNFDFLFGRNDDVEDLVFHRQRADTAAKTVGDVFFVARVRVDRVPAASEFKGLFRHISELLRRAVGWRDDRLGFVEIDGRRHGFYGRSDDGLFRGRSWSARERLFTRDESDGDEF
jgi:hypothetical protein